MATVTRQLANLKTMLTAVRVLGVTARQIVAFTIQTRAVAKVTQVIALGIQRQRRIAQVSATQTSQLARAIRDALGVTLTAQELTKRQQVTARGQLIVIFVTGLF
jgi:hypothetical protein